ncbi:single-stranded-DNA-specific exonuclease RecJ [candidate division WOR-1 bacterium RIFCSPLOWO2_02_FULL_46_20]|uniref:Single-stranded-DNA-specific exonuclease RecJ n=2 Tax=Saganbacteria TaxID=1703751 RepID=A0A1F4R6U8_UNCSA|nr:MAG: single-stranded-DNA-specific exonuclease RecJ [candidate division WOR-1 bacterium RIFCSPLOWO2_02_FULL_46_20]OGC09816.1 MAG: single-stranded-DNA-specific exonuclease RecJ [candidate division WOR-1 bacterium RIFCSPLOWO2_12_FULL_45_9]
MSKLWQSHKPDQFLSQTLSQELSVSPLTAQVLINRGIKTAQAGRSFLRPRLADLSDPMELPNVVAAAKRVLLARERSEKICVFGDYDVDGVTGTAILMHTLRFLKIPATYYIPHRYGEGYSLSLESVKKIAETGVKLIITVDCGVSNFKEIEEANKLGLEVIVTDHHNIPRRLPEAVAIVNPKLADQPTRDLSGAGVAFKFAWALLRIAGEKDSRFLTSLLDLAALGTVSDVVILTGENRVIAKVGLGLINQNMRLGIKHLARIASLPDKISVNNIYFGLAPRINAAGRLEHASKSVDLLLSDDDVEAQGLAVELNKINVRRQGIGSEIKEEVFAQLTEEYVKNNKVVVLVGHDWHPGVIGIVASRVVDCYNRPTILIGLNDGVGRGSARSLAGVNIYKLLNACSDLFIDFGGHAGAAGFEIEADKVDEFRRKINTIVDNYISLNDLAPRILIEAELDPADITLNLARELEVLDPHGEGNPRPVFMSRKFSVADARKVGKDGRHLKLKFTNGLEAIGFSLGAFSDGLSYDKVYDIAYRLEANEWNGFDSAQLSLVDIREART